jgi:hypothetical protein
LNPRDPHLKTNHGVWELGAARGESFGACEFLHLLHGKAARNSTKIVDFSLGKPITLPCRIYWARKPIAAARSPEDRVSGFIAQRMRCIRCPGSLQAQASYGVAPEQFQVSTLIPNRTMQSFPRHGQPGKNVPQRHTIIGQFGIRIFVFLFKLRFSDA